MTGGTQSEFSYTDYEFSLEQISAEAQTIK